MNSGNKPNIILILIDDMAWNGSSIQMDKSMPNSATPIVNMPRLERFAQEGMRFRNAYAGAPQCAPARVCIQTGMSSARSGFTVYLGGKNSYPAKDARPPLDVRREHKMMSVIPTISDMNLDRHETSIAEALAPLGYVSAHFGKWHMRGDGPGDHGYVEHDGDTDNKKGNQRIAKDPKLMFSITNRSIDFMKRQVQAGRPFYLQASHYAVHAGWECLEESEKLYNKNPTIVEAFEDVKSVRQRANQIQKTAKWFSMAQDLDACIGMVLDQVEQLGIADNTYIVIVSDNGYRHWVGSMEQPLRGAKWWLWEGGLRVPMWIRGPGVKPGSVCKTNVVHYDYLPTFVELAGGAVSKLGAIDGVSLKSLIRGGKVSEILSNRALYFHYPHYRTSVPHSAVVAQKWKCMHFYETPDKALLFDLESDLGETVNVADRYPDKQQALFKQMMSYLKDRKARFPQPNPEYDPEKLKAWYEEDPERLKAKTKKDEWRWKFNEK